MIIDPLSFYSRGNRSTDSSYVRIAVSTVIIHTRRIIAGGDQDIIFDDGAWATLLLS